ncbi:MAG: hypothetical protein Q8R53_03495 [Nanoarchaeota archaeon]|nr:hypothetical protein [Nanoarchaeota archaeon]
MAKISSKKKQASDTPRDLEEVVYVSWEYIGETGREPRGCSLHRTLADYHAFLDAEYYRAQDDGLDYLKPRPAGEPSTVYASPVLYRRIKSSTSGVRCSPADEMTLVAQEDLFYIPPFRG